MSERVMWGHWHFPVVVIAAAMLAAGAASPVARGQASSTDSADRLTVHLTDPSRPGFVTAHLVIGGITVKAYDGKDILIEARTRDTAPVRTENGMHRLSVGTTGLTAEEENNDVNISTESFMRPVDLALTVPVHTSLTLHTVNGGNISVSGVDGDLDVNVVNGSVTLENVSGSAVAHTVNGRVAATFAHVNALKPMAFSSVNGEIDVTFPADLKASLSLHSFRGDVFSDFDVQMQGSFRQPIVEDSSSRDGKYRVLTDRAVYATINGGGAEIQFNNLNGNIYIRKAGGTH
ncbi:MAG: DUF4097 family beta strand repeat-containing protein [Candidatus Acidiferrales bacterium]|jgi:DUF4097 and DUF4098 domain-containing protein YvlB